MTKRQIFVFGAAVAFACVALLVDHLLTGSSSFEKTDDAYVTADFSVVAPKVAGLIDRVEVDDNEPVRAGQQLAHIDDRDYRAAVSAAEAALAATKADVENHVAELARQKSVIEQASATVRADEAVLSFAQANATRYRNLSRGGAGTVEQQEQSASQLQQAVAANERDVAAAAAAEHQLAILAAERERAEANVQREQAALEQARLNLSYTNILAPVDGVVGERSVRVGNYVSPGTALLAVVQLNSAYVLANFQETQLTDVRSGQQARITVDTFPGQSLNGTVDSLAPASGIAFSPIPPDNATGNFTKVTQRIPLKIRLDRGQQLSERLRVGMSVEVSLDTASRVDDRRDGVRATDHEASQ
jgi:membrane fusion protein (multidrug efflux system)